MLDDDRMPDREQVDTALIWIDPDRADWRDAALLLETAGGRSVADAQGAVYRFPTRATRDLALERVRRRFGWTIAGAVSSAAPGGPRHAEKPHRPAPPETRGLPETEHEEP